MAALGTQPHSKALAVLLFLLVTTASAALLPESEHTTLGAKTEFDLSAFNIAANEPPSANVTANVSGPPPTSPIITSGALADLDTHPPTLAQLAHITPSLSAMESEASSASPPDLHSTKITLGSPKAALGQGPGQTTVPEGSKKPSVEPEIQLAGPKESRGQENQTVPGRRELSSTASIHPFKVGGTDWSGEKHPIPASTSWTVPASTDRTIPASTDHSIPASTDHSIPTSADWTVPPPTILTTQGWLTPKATPAFTPTSKEKPDSKVTYSELPTPSPSPAATTHSIAVSIIVAIVTAVLLVLCLCAVILCYRRHRRGSTSFQTGAGEWAGPVPSPEEQAAVLSGDGVKEAGQGESRRPTLTTFFGKRHSRVASVALEDVAGTQDEGPVGQPLLAPNEHGSDPPPQGAGEANGKVPSVPGSPSPPTPEPPADGELPLPPPVEQEALPPV